LLTLWTDQKTLTYSVVDLVRDSMVKVLALEVVPRPADLLAQSLGIVQRRRPAHVLAEVRVQLGFEPRIAARLLVLPGELLEGGNQCLGNVPPAEGAEAAARIRKLRHRRQYRLQNASNQSTIIAGGGPASPPAKRVPGPPVPTTTSNSWRW